MNVMTDYLRKHVTIGNIINIILLIAAIIWSSATQANDIKKNSDWNTRQDQAIQELVRKDVFTAQYQSIIYKLDQIQKQLNERKNNGQ